MYPSISQFRAQVTATTATSLRCSSPPCRKTAPVKPNRTLNGGTRTVRFRAREFFRVRSHITSLRSRSSHARGGARAASSAMLGKTVHQLFIKTNTIHKKTYRFQIISLMRDLSPRFRRSRTFFEGTA